MSAAAELEKARRAYAGSKDQRDTAQVRKSDGLTRGSAAGSAQAGGSR